jgi:hypothetical protein
MRLREERTFPELNNKIVTDKHSNPGVMAPKIGDPWNPVDDSRV